MLPSKQFGDVAGGSHFNGLPKEKTPGLVWAPTNSLKSNFSRKC